MISVIIVNYRTPDDLLRLIASLEAHPPAGEPLEILVVDNASGDDSAGRLRAAHPDIPLIESEVNRGFAGGVNLGLARATGEWLLILNPDIVVHPGSLDALVAFMKAHPQAGIAAAKLLNPDGTLQPTCRTGYTLRTILLRRTFLGRLFPNDRALRDHLMLDYDHATPRDVDWVAGACLMVRREALEEVGPMDERYFLYFEDVDWCTRMHRRGWGVWYVPDAVMTHGYRRASAGGFGKAARAHAGSLLRFWEKWSALLYLVRRYRGAMRNALFLVADLASITLAFFLAYFLREATASIFHKPNFPVAHYEGFLGATLLVALTAFILGGLYREGDRGDWLDTLFSVGKSMLATSLFLLAAIYVLGAGRSYSRFIILTFWPLAMILVTLERRTLYRWLERARETRLNVKRVALVGQGAAIEDLARSLRHDPRHGFEPIRIMLPPAERPEALRAALEDERVSDVVISTDALPQGPGEAARLIDPLRAAGIRVHMAGPLSEILGREARITPLAGRSMLTLGTGRGLSQSRFVRRGFESVVAFGFGLVQTVPAAVAALLVPLTGGRGRLERGGAEWAVEGAAGVAVRRLSLDRFPGWWLVIGGKRRLVGNASEALFSGGDVATQEESGYPLPWSPERDLKTVVRDLLTRLRGGSGAAGVPPYLERSHRSALR